ncbi:uncharacterized protein LOC111088808 [Limulus polyphemus]|uniref:Uncharacterized protein LOC111088808 n=1 Tax=Limulus polyphemus TaxID=6850 RepID=A0ABM1TI50_LIMPO|nr:uncharacterized protein LOC111088808 [Limulus polyphemus]
MDYSFFTFSIASFLLFCGTHCVPFLANSKVKEIKLVVNETAELPCLAFEEPKEDFHWVFPDGNVVDKTAKDKSFHIIHENASLIFSPVDITDGGLYICIAGNQKTFNKASFVHMEVKPIPVVLSTWEKYKSNAETGLIAAACAAAIIIIPCLLYKFQWKPREKKSTQKEVEPSNQDSPEPTVVSSNQTPDPGSSLSTENIKPVAEEEATKPESVSQNNAVAAAPDENIKQIVEETATSSSASKNDDLTYPLVIESDSAENETVAQESDSSAYENKGSEIFE